MRRDRQYRHKEQQRGHSHAHTLAKAQHKNYQRDSGDEQQGYKMLSRNRRLQAPSVRITRPLHDQLDDTGVLTLFATIDGEVPQHLSMPHDVIGQIAKQDGQETYAKQRIIATSDRTSDSGNVVKE